MADTTGTLDPLGPQEGKRRGSPAVAPISPERLSELIGLIYDAAIDSDRWPIAMEAIRVELDCAISTLNLQALPSFDVILNVTANVPEQFVPMIEHAGQDVIEQWGGEAVLLTLALEEPHVLSRVNPLFDPDTARNRYFDEFARPQQLIDVLAIGLARDERGFGSVSFGRHATVGPITGREVALARLLIPHLQRAATINRLLDLSAIAKATFEAAIDTLSVPVLLTDDLMRIVYANPAARRMLECGDLIREQSGLLSAASRPVTRALEIAIERASNDIGALGRKGLGIPVRRSDGESGALHVLPLRQGAALAPRAAVAIFVAHTGTPFIAPTEIVAALFDLTPAELRVFDRIVGGQTVAEAAVALGVEASTIKTHMLRVYEKTGVRRRSELQQMASSLIVPIAA